MSAHCRERVLLLDQSKRLRVFPLCRLLKIPLNGDVCRACRLARRGTRVVTVDPVVIPVIFIPFIRSPARTVRQFLFRIGDRAFLRTQLLPELHRSRRTVFHAPPAGDTVFCRYPSHVRRTGHVRSVEQLGGPKRVADIDIAVADGKYLVPSVYVRYLMDKPIVLGALQDIQNFFICNVSSTLVRLHHIVRHITYRDTPVLGIVRTAFVICLSGHSARTWACSVFSVILSQPVGYVLDIHGFIFHLNGFLHRYDVHAYPRAALRHHGRDLLQRKPGHALEESA